MFIIKEEKRVCLKLKNKYKVVSGNSSDIYQWYAMAPIYSKDIEIKSYLDAKGIVNYIPSRWEIVKRNGKKQLVCIPVIKGLLFIYTTEEELKYICKEQPYLYYKYDREGGKGKKMTIPSKQMEDFIKITQLEDKNTIFFDPNEERVDLSKGTAVRIHSSNTLLDGVEGKYIKMDGKKQKRVIISLNGLWTAAMLVDINLLEKI